VRAALYAMVSSEEQVEGYSIDAQRRAFQALVVAEGGRRIEGMLTRENRLESITSISVQHLRR
jgi:DNA invertase Pin-like site-specific DNA recombinase